MPSEVLAALALFVTSGGAAAASAPGLAVVEVAAPSTMQGLALQITRQVQDAARAQGLKVVPPEEVETFLGPKNTLALKQCGGSATCVATGLGDLPVARAVVGTLSRDETHYLVHLWLISLSPPAVVTEVDRAILISSRRLKEDVAAAVPGFLRGQPDAKGTLVLDASVPGCEGVLDGEPVGPLPVTRSLKPGKHQVRVTHPGFYPVERLVAVDPAKTTHEVVRMVGIPGAMPDLAALTPAAAAAPADSRSTGFRIPVAGWVALGVGVAAAGAGTWLAVASHDNQTQLQAGYDPARNSYQGFRSQAVTGQNQATWANVCFGIAGAGLVTWGVLTWIASTTPSAPSAPHAAIGIGPQGASVAVAGTF